MKLVARLALLICVGVFFSAIRIDSRKLPERIASHFDKQGDANG